MVQTYYSSLTQAVILIIDNTYIFSHYKMNFIKLFLGKKADMYFDLC